MVLSAAGGVDGAFATQAESSRLNIMATNDKRYIIFIFLFSILKLVIRYKKHQSAMKKNINNKIEFVEISFGTNCWQELDLQTPFF